MAVIFLQGQNIYNNFNKINKNVLAFINPQNLILFYKH